MNGKRQSPDLSPERKAEIEALFDDAMDLPPDRRDAWLAARCGADDELRDEVEALLSGLDHAERMFDPQAANISKMARELVPVALPERRIGQYRVVRELGRGGMGVVYLAERADGHHHRRVAIKVVRIDEEQKEVQRRFLAEGRILASLSHANIAQLLDAGVMDNGTPYIVMEYVDGMNITTYCERNNLSIRDRLALFQDVCAAVHHAHSNLVLHRDVKPGNILVTRDGRVKLLDFGIAKLLEGNGGDDAPRDHTRTGARPMTPAYASPEQVRGEPLSTASDVYALGMVLYEMLTGVRAYDVESHAPAAALALISEKEPLKPSARDSRHASELRDDLDAIVMMSLRKEAGQRYASADQFATDISRYLDGRPVRAHESSRIYHVRRFVRRHRVAVLTSVLLFTGVAAGLSVALWQTREATRARAAADAARDLAMAANSESEQVSDFMIGLFDNRDDYSPLRDTLMLQSLLSRGMKRLAEVNEPLARASMLDALGRVQRNLENIDESERLMWDALRLREKHARANDPATARTLERLADLQRRRGNYTLADSLATRALAINRAAFGNVHSRVAYNLRQRATFAVFLNDLKRAESFAAAAVDARPSGTPDDDVRRARDIESLASMQWRMGRISESIKTMTEAERVARQAHACPDSVAVDMQLHRAEIMSHVRSLQGEAIVLARKAMAEQFALSAPTDPVRSSAMAWAAPIIAMQYPDEGLRLLRQSLELERRTFGDKPPRVTGAKEALALMLLRMGRTDEATKLIRDVVASSREQFGTQHTAYASAIGFLSDALLARGDLDSATTLVKEAVAIRTSIFGSEAPITKLSSMGFARIAVVRGDTAAADSIYRTVREVILRQSSVEHPDIQYIDSVRASLRPSADRARPVRVGKR